MTSPTCAAHGITWRRKSLDFALLGLQHASKSGGVARSAHGHLAKPGAKACGAKRQTFEAFDLKDSGFTMFGSSKLEASKPF